MCWQYLILLSYKYHNRMTNLKITIINQTKKIQIKKKQKWKYLIATLTSSLICLTFCWPCIMQWFLVIVQLDAQIPFNIFIYISLHVSSMSCSSSEETDCISRASGKCHSMLVAVSCAGWEFTPNPRVHLPLCTRNNVHKCRICCHNNINTKKFIF